jgi:hypothetical protein
MRRRWLWRMWWRRLVRHYSVRSFASQGGPRVFEWEKRSPALLSLSVAF